MAHCTAPASSVPWNVTSTKVGPNEGHERVPSGPDTIDTLGIKKSHSYILIRPVKGMQIRMTQQCTPRRAISKRRWRKSEVGEDGNNNSTHAMVHIGSIFPVALYSGAPLLKSSFHSDAPKCSQTTAATAFASSSGRSVIQSVSLRCPPDMCPVVITKLNRQ
ncbi:uncharacterized protein BT62DRAFT_427567 [Guyanagaster necrorhizus]|uniref:Uncharacterized protein n=1 Tax=Guyanagaster necrorhizus TaxID=856835 RepID=A0A9P8AZ14_9AGAR|nr:uncharacterized protein BT62DRAFT_427567 [Guyanagaster necrorhizus MCA 3950]KAG7451492.1 hypothetical protein BT62DRAFT_427567 [Guyanagaster necrorhizus MCA 3950]